MSTRHVLEKSTIRSGICFSKSEEREAIKPAKNTDERSRRNFTDSINGSSALCKGFGNVEWQWEKSKTDRETACYKSFNRSGEFPSFSAIVSCCVNHLEPNYLHLCSSPELRSDSEKLKDIKRTKHQNKRTLWQDINQITWGTPNISFTTAQTS